MAEKSKTAPRISQRNWVIAFFFIELCFMLNMTVSYYLFHKANPFIQVQIAFLAKGTLCIAGFVILSGLINSYFKKKYPSKSIFDCVIDNRYTLSAILFIFALAFQLNGFSFSMWDKYIHTTDGINLILGMRRDITSDTWALALPAIFSQIENGFHLYNYDIMKNGTNALLMGLPVWDITTLGRPFMWGYLFLGKSTGLSWHYCLKLFALLLSSYEICYCFTKGDKRVSALFAVVISFSPPIMWWFGQTIIDTIIYFQICCVTLYRYFEGTPGLWGRIGLMGLCTLSGVSFILVLYPAFQVSLGILFLIVAFFLIKDNREIIVWRRWDTLLFVICLCIVAGLVGRFMVLCGSDLKRLADTVYPGARVVIGGGFDRSTLYYYYMQWLLPLKSTPIYNNCEMSFFIPFIPSILMIFPFVMRKTKMMFHVALYVYELFLISWLLIPYPSWVGKVTLFSYVTESRLTLIIGLVGMYLAVIACTTCSVKEIVSKTSALVLFVMNILFIGMIFSLYNGGGYTDFLGKFRTVPLVISFVLYGFFNFVYIYGYKTWTTRTLIAFVVMCGMTVNPIALGSGSFFSNPLALEIAKVEREHPNSYWLINENFPYSNYLLAHGIRSFNVLNSYEDTEKWKAIDPSGKYRQITNRYAHVSVKLINEETKLRLLAPDAIEVQMNNDDVKKLHISYVLSKDVLSYDYMMIYHDPISGFGIYKVIE